MKVGNEVAGGNKAAAVKMRLVVVADVFVFGVKNDKAIRFGKINDFHFGGDGCGNRAETFQMSFIDAG